MSEFGAGNRLSSAKVGCEWKHRPDLGNGTKKNRK
jgi:hypothetical protein